jgi:uncharacterized protein YqjF (DUF2071 family)
MSERRPFLTAEWRWLVMLNYEIDPALLKSLVPSGTELDSFQGVTYVSVVGFRFLQTRVFGLAIPFHRNFEEVNLRFYVRRKWEGEWRRGVVFVRELVPRRLIAWVARTVYHEPYLALPMSHRIEQDSSGVRCSYAWERLGRTELIEAQATGDSVLADENSEEAFITEHYWGYSSHAGETNEYQVEHPRWRVWRAQHARFEADVGTLYGDRFVATLAQAPRSAFIADGSPVTVRMKSTL